MIPPTLLLTRPRPSAEAFAARLDPKALARVRLVISPVIEIVSTGMVPQVGPTQSVIFTSGNAVARAPEGAGRGAYCVGAQTTAQARGRGWVAQQRGETAEELVAALMACPPKGPLMHLGGVHTRGDVAQRLTQAGIETVHHALYDQQVVPLTDAAHAALLGPCIIPVFSPRSAAQLIKQASGQLGQAHVIALSPPIAALFRREMTTSLFILPAPRRIYMCKHVEKLCLSVTLP